MTKIEAVKIQAKMLEGKSKKWYSLTCANRPDCVWLSNGIIIVRIPIEFYMLNVPENIGINGYTTLPEDAVKGWLTETRFKDKGEGMLVKAEAIGTEARVKEKCIKLFGKADKYNVWITPKAVWLTVPDTGEVLGVIAGVRGIKL